MISRVKSACLPLAMSVGLALLPSAASAQLTATGNVSQSSEVNVLAAIAAAPFSTAIVRSSVIERGASVSGSVIQRSSGGARIALAAGFGSSASVSEATICGNVRGSANLQSHIGTAASVSLLPGGHTRISAASVGPGHQGSVSSYVSVGTVIAVDFIPWADSTIVLGSTRGGC